MTEVKSSKSMLNKTRYPNLLRFKRVFVLTRRSIKAFEKAPSRGARMEKIITDC